MVGGLPVCHFGFPGPQRDKLVAAVLRGEKTATASLRLEYEPEGPDELPRPACAGWSSTPATGRWQ